MRVYLSRPFPKFELCRIDKNDGGTCFGPYTSGLAARAALEFVEKRFGIRQCKPDQPDAETYKHCHNDIIRQCAAPCIGKVTPEEYMDRVQTACAFLRGERPEFIKEVRAQMEAAAEKHRFEEAAALRDEAHRFAISYHRRLRSQRIRESALDEISTIGIKKKELLLKHFGSFERLRRASFEELCAAPGIGQKTAELILQRIT